MYDSTETAKRLGLTPRSITHRASRLNIKKRGVHWIFTEADYLKIKNYEPIKQFQSKFYFSKNGKYLIINSRMNKL